MRERGRDKSVDTGRGEPQAAGIAPGTLTAVDDLVTQTNDPVLGLRGFGTLIEHRFLAGPWDVLHVGSDPSCEIRIVDPSVSRQHARIVRDGPRLMVVDERSKNGTYAGTFAENCRIAVFELRPGAWVSFGQVHMTAFSAWTEATRARLQRFLGFGARYLPDLDRLTFAAVRRRRHVVLRVPSAGAPGLAHILHETAPGGAWPFVATTKRIGDQAAQLALLDRARSGTLVIDGQHWPRDPAVLRGAYSVQVPDSRLVLVVQRDATPDPSRDLRLMPIDVPNMEERGPEETERAINMTAAEYGTPLGLTADPFTPREWADFRRRAWGSPENIEFHVRRMVRVLMLGVSEAAKLEGVKAPAMSRWASRNVEKARLRD